MVCAHEPGTEDIHPLWKAHIKRLANRVLLFTHFHSTKFNSFNGPKAHLMRRDLWTIWRANVWKQTGTKHDQTTKSHWCDQKHSNEMQWGKHVRQAEWQHRLFHPGHPPVITHRPLCEGRTLSWVADGCWVLSAFPLLIPNCYIQ